jgi:hypothetical protein
MKAWLYFGFIIAICFGNACSIPIHVPVKLQSIIVRRSYEVNAWKQSIIHQLQKKLKLCLHPQQSTSDVLAGDRSFLDKIDSDNAVALLTLQAIFRSNSTWTFVGEKDGVYVERCTLPAGSFVSATDAARGSKHACIKSSGVVDAPPEKIYQLFLDNSRVKEYNEHCKEVRDVHFFPKPRLAHAFSKISYAISPPYGPFKARDFCSIVYCEQHRNGGYLIMNRPAYLNAYPPKAGFVRATILLAGNVIEPYGKRQSKVTVIAHVNPGGGADTATAAWFINKLCARGPPDFIRKLEKAARSDPS